MKLFSHPYSLNRLVLVLSFLGSATSTHADPEFYLPARFLIGPAQRTQVPMPNAEEMVRLRRDIPYRNEWAWRFVEHWSAQVPFVKKPDATLPRWATLYEPEDAKNLFTVADAADSVSSLGIGDWETAYLGQFEKSGLWSGDAFLRWLNPIADSLEKLRGSMGLSRTLYDRSSLEHMYQHRESLKNCQNTPCFDEEFPLGTVIFKLAWQRLDKGFKIPVFFTGEADLKKRFDSVLGSWDEPDTYQDGSAFKGYTVSLRDGSRFGLVAMHAMVKTHSDWLWLTMWWNGVSHLTVPYQLCSVVDFQEESRDGKRSWCSNPYFEKGPHNARTNCIGCHQHAGSGARQEWILSSDHGEAASHPALDRVRGDFPSDYVYGAYRDIAPILRGM